MLVRLRVMWVTDSAQYTPTVRFGVTPTSLGESATGTSDTCELPFCLG